MKYEEIRERLRRIDVIRDKTHTSKDRREDQELQEALHSELDLLVQGVLYETTESQTGVPKGVNRDLLDVWSELRRDIQEAKEKQQAHLQEASRWRDRMQRYELELAELELKKPREFRELFQAIADSYK